MICEPKKENQQNSKLEPQEVTISQKDKVRKVLGLGISEPRRAGEGGEAEDVCVGWMEGEGKGFVKV